jgi:hypothetical protein
MEPGLLACPHALHHTAEPSGVVLPDADDKRHVLAKILGRLHPRAPFATACLFSLDGCTRAAVPGSFPAAWKMA